MSTSWVITLPFIIPYANWGPATVIIEFLASGLSWPTRRPKTSRLCVECVCGQLLWSAPSVGRHYYLCKSAPDGPAVYSQLFDNCTRHWKLYVKKHPLLKHHARSNAFFWIKAPDSINTGNWGLNNYLPFLRNSQP